MRNWLALACLVIATSSPVARALFGLEWGELEGNFEGEGGGDSFYGKTFSEWGAEWWKWFLGLPATDHPASDLDGCDCRSDQSGPVFFLAGAFTTESTPTDPPLNVIVREHCSVGLGKALFFPVLNVLCNNVATDPGFRLDVDGTNEATCAPEFAVGPNAYMTDMVVTVDGNAVVPVRATSDRFSFEFGDNCDNIEGVDCTGCGGSDTEVCSDMYGTSDGYWVGLEPLSWGRHTVQFEGSFRDAASGGNLYFGLDVTYELWVGPPDLNWFACGFYEF